MSRQREGADRCQGVRVSVFGGNKSISLSPALSLLQAACAKLQKHSLVIPCDWNFLSVSLVLNSEYHLGEGVSTNSRPAMDLPGQSELCMSVHNNARSAPAFISPEPPGDRDCPGPSHPGPGTPVSLSSSHPVYDENGFKCQPPLLIE